MTNKKIPLKRMNINLPVSLVERVIEYGNNLGLNTTSSIIVLLNNALDQSETIKYLPTVLAELQNVKEKQDVNIKVNDAD